jgi:hypothetical protein
MVCCVPLKVLEMCVKTLRDPTQGKRGLLAVVAMFHGVDGIVPALLDYAADVRARSISASILSLGKVLGIESHRLA